MSDQKRIGEVDAYIAGFPEEVQQMLRALRDAIWEAAPEAEEAIAYGTPTFRLNGNLVHFAGYKKHIGFYPTPSVIEEFRAELTGYKQSKGAVQFPLNQPLPLDLVKRFVAFRVQENLARK